MYYKRKKVQLENEIQQADKFDIDIDESQMIQLKLQQTNYEHAREHLKQMKLKKQQDGNYQWNVNENNTILESNKAQNLKHIQFQLNSVHQNQLKQLIQQYKQTHPTKFSQGVDKDRFQGRESLFQNLAYCLEEIEQKYEESDITLDESLRRFGLLSFNEKFELARKLAIEIEANIFTNYNKSDRAKIKPEYKSRFRVILANLKNEQNFELRSKIVSGQITTYILSTMSEAELLNSEKRQQLLNRQEQNQRISIIEEGQVMIAKTHKGDFIITNQKEQDFTYQDSENKKITTLKELKLLLQDKNGNAIINNNQNEIFTDITNKQQKLGLSHNKMSELDEAFLKQLNDTLNYDYKSNFNSRLQKYLPDYIADQLKIF